MKKWVLVAPALRPPRKGRGKRGAPFGNRNAFKHGKFTRERRALYADIRAHIRCGRALIAAFERGTALSPHFHLDRTILTSVNELIDIRIAAVVDLRRRTFPDNLATIEHGDAVGDLARADHVVGDR